MKKLMFFVLALALIGNLAANDFQTRKGNAGAPVLQNDVSGARVFVAAANKKGSPKDILFEEGFEGDTFPPAGWLIVDSDGDTNNWGEIGFAGHSGTKTATSASYINDSKGPLTPDNWLITPQISAPLSVEYWVSAQDADWAGEHYGVFVSTTGTDVADFELVFEETMTAKAAGAWYERSVDLSSYADQDIYVAFRHFDCTDMFMLNIDDIVVKNGTVSADTDVPVFESLTGATAANGDDMNLTLTVSDATGIVSPIIATYNISDSEMTIEMTPGKSEFVFTGTIPAEEDMQGTISFDVTDTAPAANNVVLGPYDIAWESNSIEEGWFGAVDAQNTSGLGLQNSAPWKLGMILDFGTEEFYINKIGYMCNNGTVGPLNWGVLDVTEEGAWTADVLIDDQLLTNEPVIGAEWVEVNTTDNTVLTGKIGLTVDLTGGGYWARDEVSTVGISYIYYNDTWMLLGEGDLASYPGDWVLKAWAGPTEGIEEEIVAGSTELYQNYPNPFNPSTTINFFNNMSGDVKLSVFNVKGELVSTLVNGHMSASQHSVNFNAANLNSGVYYYTLKTPTKSITKKMILVK